MTQQEYENKIKELEQQVKELKSVKVAEKGAKWKPEDGERYWSVCDNGFCDYSRWDNDNVDNWRYLTGNCFKTKEEAEEHRNQIEYTARYKNYIEEHSGTIDWDNNFQWKYFAEINTERNEINVDSYRQWKGQGAIYASSEEIILDAIEEIGEDNFKKYVLGIK